MAFYFATGVMGGGKSYKGAELILACLREGGVAHTNMPMRLDEIDELWERDRAAAGEAWDGRLPYRQRLIMLPADIRGLVKVIPGVRQPDGTMGEDTLQCDLLQGGEEGSENLVVFDEASWKISADDQMNAGEKEKNKPLFRLVALCRHIGLDLYFLAQDAGHVNSKLRDMAEYRIKCVKVARIPMAGWLMELMPWWGTFLRVYYTGKSKTPTGRTWHKFRKEVGAIYDTHGMRNGVAIRRSATRRKGMDVTERKGKFVAVMVLGLLVSLATYSCVSGRKVYKDLTAGSAPKAGAASPSSPVAVAPVSEASQKQVVSGPKKATTHKSREFVEWDEADEVPYYAVLRDGRGCRVQVKGGAFLRVGGNYEGEVLTQLVVYGGWYYFTAESGRVFVARPFNAKEKAQLAAAKDKKPGVLGVIDKFTGEPQ